MIFFQISEFFSSIFFLLFMFRFKEFQFLFCFWKRVEFGGKFSKREDGAKLGAALQRRPNTEIKRPSSAGRPRFRSKGGKK